MSGKKISDLFVLQDGIRGLRKGGCLGIEFRVRPFSVMEISTSAPPMKHKIL